MRRDARTEGLRWLEQAEADREGARLLFEGGSYHLARFVAQQVTEKAIQAFIYAQGEEFVIGHSVEVLCRMVATFDPDFETLRTAVAPLDGYYLPTRYPDTPGSPIFKVVQKKQCKALYRALKKSPTAPEFAVGEGSERSHVDRSVVPPE
jgi:HEPN domain-containing protein